MAPFQGPSPAAPRREALIFPLAKLATQTLAPFQLPSPADKERGLRLVPAAHAMSTAGLKRSLHVGPLFPVHEEPRDWRHEVRREVGAKADQLVAALHEAMTMVP